MVALPAPELTPPVERSLRDLVPAGVILFARNLRSPVQARELIGGIREVVGFPVLVAVDQEGGPVNRLTALSPVFQGLPAARTQAGWDQGQLEVVWTAVGQALAAIGFDVDFAPVVDLDDGPGTNAIGPRSFGLDPGLASSCAEEILAGLERAGVAGCLKHFPGLGGTDLDTHLGQAQSPLAEKELRERHTQPYANLRERAPLVMTAHASYPTVDGPEAPAATFSRRLIGEWLRDRIGYDGLVVSDDLEMGAVSRAQPGDRARRTLEAGADLALFCQDLDAPRRARDELASLLARGDLSDAVAVDSGRRLAGVLGRFPGGRAEIRNRGTVFDEAVAALADALAAAGRSGS